MSTQPSSPLAAIREQALAKTEATFDSLVTRIRNATGCGKEFASDYATFIGDKPEIQNGQVLVRNEEGKIIARLPEKVLKGG